MQNDNYLTKTFRTMKTMATNIFKKTRLIAFALAIGLLFTACQENFEFEKTEQLIEFQSYENQIIFTQGNLNTLGMAALSIADDPEFREIVYKEIEKQFDGDYNVLFETLSQVQTSDQSTIGARMAATSKIDEKLYLAMEAFKSIEGKDYYPQIYIPFYEELKEKKVSSNAKVLSPENEPVIVLFTGDDSQDAYPGYQLNEGGELEVTGFMVDEEYAQNNEVWVISLNERYFGENDSSSEANGSINGRTKSSPSAIVDQIKIKCHKESWAAGASEVNILTLFSNWGATVLNLNVYGHGVYEGGQIYKFSRKDVRKQRNKDVNFYILNDWDDRAPDMPYGNYVIFEYDTWPTGRKTAEWYVGATISIQYRSADIYYDLNTVYKTNFYGYYINNGCIEWLGQYQ